MSDYLSDTRLWYTLVVNGRLRGVFTRYEGDAIAAGQDEARESPQNIVQIVRFGIETGHDPGEEARRLGVADGRYGEVIWEHLGRSRERSATANREESSSGKIIAGVAVAALLAVLLVVWLMTRSGGGGHDHPTPSPSMTSTSSLTSSTPSSTSQPSASTVTQTQTRTETETRTASPSSSSSSSSQSTTTASDTPSSTQSNQGE